MLCTCAKSDCWYLDVRRKFQRRSSSSMEGGIIAVVATHLDSMACDLDTAQEALKVTSFQSRSFVTEQRVCSQIRLQLLACISSESLGNARQSA